MIGTFILLVLCTCFGIAISMTFDAFANDGKMWEKVGGIIMCCLIGLLTTITHFACIETARNQTMQDYFEGKVEVIEQIDTTRTFKFN